MYISARFEAASTPFPAVEKISTLELAWPFGAYDTEPIRHVRLTSIRAVSGLRLTMMMRPFCGCERCWVRLVWRREGMERFPGTCTGCKACDDLGMTWKSYGIFGQFRRYLVQNVG